MISKLWSSFDYSPAPMGAGDFTSIELFLRQTLRYSTPVLRLGFSIMNALYQSLACQELGWCGVVSAHEALSVEAVNWSAGTSCCRAGGILHPPVVESGGQSFATRFRAEWDQQQAEREGDGSERHWNPQRAKMADA